jgi:hypothetical protein
LPEVQAILSQHFDGRPIKPQNLYEWKQGGYAVWLHQKLTSAARPVQDENADPALRELRNLCRTIVLDNFLSHLAWYRRGLLDAIADASGE